MTVVNDYTALLSGDYWNGIEVTGEPTIVTFSFPTTLPSYDVSVDGFSSATAATFKPFTAQEQSQAISALNEWASASGLVFVEVAPGQGDINFSNVDLSTTDYAGAGGIGFYPYGNWTYSSLPYFTDDLTTSGDVFMNSQFQNTSDGTVNYGTLLHEIGHAIGLKHPTQDVYDNVEGVDHNQVLSSDDPTRTIMAEVADTGTTDPHILQLDKDAAAAIYGPAGTGGVYTSNASGSNSVSTWNWDAATQTLTQTANVATGEEIRGSSVNDIINGSAGDDKLFGLEGNNKLYGGDGNDSLYGGTGVNLLVGGAGNDSYYVNSTSTTVVEEPGGGNDTVYSTVDFTMGANVETLQLFGDGLTGRGNDQGVSIFGDGTFGSTIIGGAGADYLVGGAGNDVIEGNGGADLMYGKGGADRFVFTKLADAPVSGSGETTIADFLDGSDKIDLSGIRTTGTDSGLPLHFIGNAAFSDQAGEVDEVQSGNNTLVQGDVNGDGIADFAILLDGMHTLQSSNFIMESPACYCAGTLIETVVGGRAVETLAIGDEVLNYRGHARPIKWISRRSYGARFIAGRKDLLPICFKAGSLGENLPRRDLRVSPHHAMYLDGVLIEAKDLINGVSVTQVEEVAEVAYFHVELATHDVILAEGAASETFVDDDSRGIFHNASEYQKLYPDDRTTPARYCAPRRDNGYEVEAVRRKIAVRAGSRVIDGNNDLPLRGFVDSISAHRVSGWAQNPEHPEAPVCLEILLNNAVIGHALANCYRPDLEQAGMGSGCHSFEFLIPDGIAADVDSIKVRRAFDSRIIASSQISKETVLAAA